MDREDKIFNCAEPQTSFDSSYQPSSRGCEVFVGKLARETGEEELERLFSECGSVTRVRVITDAFGFNRGFSFVTFSTPEEAKRAVSELNDYEISPGRHIGVVPSVDNRRLFIGGVPRSKTKKDISEELSRFCSDPDYIADVTMYQSMDDPTKNRGFAFVEFQNHQIAAGVRRNLLANADTSKTPPEAKTIASKNTSPTVSSTGPTKVPLWNVEVAVDWAEPEPVIDEAVMNQVRILYFRNLSPATSERRLHGICLSRCQLGGIDRVKKIIDFAFVHFQHRSDAETLLAALNGLEIDGSVVEVMWSKPPDKGLRKCIKKLAASHNSRQPTVEPAVPLMANRTAAGLQSVNTRRYVQQKCEESHSEAQLVKKQPPVNLVPPQLRTNVQDLTCTSDVSFTASSVDVSFATAGNSVNNSTDSLDSSGVSSVASEPVPMSPFEHLATICLQNNWQLPHYDLFSTSPDLKSPTPNSQYIYFVTITDLIPIFGSFQPKTLSPTLNEALQVAAQTAIHQIKPMIASPPSIHFTASEPVTFSLIPSSSTPQVPSPVPMPQPISSVKPEILPPPCNRPCCSQNPLLIPKPVPTGYSAGTNMPATVIPAPFHIAPGLLPMGTVPIIALVPAKPNQFLAPQAIYLNPYPIPQPQSHFIAQFPATG